MFTATLTIMDLDTGTPEAAAQALLTCAAEVRPLYIEVTDQGTDIERIIEITEYAPDVLAALKAIMPYAQSRIEDMNEAPDEHSAKATAIFEKAQRVLAEAEGRAS